MFYEFITDAPSSLQLLALYARCRLVPYAYQHYFNGLPMNFNNTACMQTFYRNNTGISRNVNASKGRQEGDDDQCLEPCERIQVHIISPALMKFFIFWLEVLS